MSVIYGLSLCIQPPPSVEEIRLKWGGCCTQATAALGSEVLPTRRGGGGGTERSAALGCEFFLLLKLVLFCRYNKDLRVISSHYRGDTDLI